MRERYSAWARFAQPAWVLLLSGVSFAVFPSHALAHIKWFAPYDVPAQPKTLTEILSPTFLELAAAVAFTLWLICLFERTEAGFALLRAIDRLSAPLRPRVEDLFRGAGAAFFVMLWMLGTVILTPELKTAVPAIPWFQAAIALGMFWRRTLVFSALGICGLYGYAIAEYGLFHMMDYPIFLGAAAYYALVGLRRDLFGMRPLDVVRWSAAITLIWASVEKWAYPQWTYPLLGTHHDITVGFGPVFYMITAGFVEFSLAFALLWTPLVRRLAACALAAMFIGAIFEFGKIDAVGHSMIIVILLAIAVDKEPGAPKTPWLAPALYGITLAIDLLAYIGFHAALFGTRLI